MSPHAMYFWPKNDRTAKTRIFPDTTLPVNDSKQLSLVSDQVLDKSDIFEQKLSIFGPKKGPKMAPIILSEEKNSLTILKQ